MSSRLDCFSTYETSPARQHPKLGERAVDEDPALVQIPIRSARCSVFVEVLRGKQHRGAAVSELADELPHLEPGIWV